MSFFDAPWHVVILLLAALLLFGSRRLPGAAKALGSSMNIFKKAVRGEDDDDEVGGITTQATYTPPSAHYAPPTPGGYAPPTPGGYVPPPAEIANASAVTSQQAQIDDLQRQLRELQRQQASGDAVPGGGAPASEAQPHGQSY
jgi:sec-independent protein translocase protein TatA